MKSYTPLKAWVTKGSVVFFIALLFFGKYFPLIFWDKIFLAGLLLFMLGGAALLLEKGVFNRFLDNCQKFMKNTSKIEAYAIEMEERQPSRRKIEGKKPVAPFLLKSGFLLIVPATLFSLIVF